MSTPSIPDETLIETVASYRAHGDNQSAAARSLGIARETLQNRLRRAAERGLMGTRETLPGYAIRQITDTPQGQYIQQRKEHGEEWRPTDGLVIKGKTSLLDAEGRIITQHVMERADSKKADLLGAITAALADHVPAAPLPAPPHTRADIITVYPVADLHLGLYAWARETGASYDVEIAAGLLRSAVQNLVGRAAPSEAAIILDLGDYFHTDSSRNQTARSANPLDVDTRYARVLRIGYELVVDAIELALQKHERVIYRKLPGNHDDETSLMLAISIAAHFRNEPRVEVDTDPSRFFVHRFGKVLIGATHGDMLKMADFGGFMATNWAKDWGATEFRYGFTGHIHHDRARVANGVKVESFNTLAAKDAWHAGMGFTSPRTAVAITLHRDHGETDRLTVSLPMLARPAAANDNEQRRAA
jgi:transposase-like protein